MTTPFLHDDFLLMTPEAVRLYHEIAAPLPIIDYHCHLSPEAIATDHRFANLTEIWLAGDHYKWRAMRTCGIEERCITGSATDYEKFEAWARTVPLTLRNPLYHWTHLELKKPFGLTNILLSPSTARQVWDHCRERLAQPEFSTRGLLRQMNVEVVCTTDDPVDTLEHHRALQADASMATRIFPAFRPDKAMAVDRPDEFRAYVNRLSSASDVSIATYDDFLRALQQRHQFFHDMGCRLSDHGLETIYAEPCTVTTARTLFDRLLTGGSLDGAGVMALKSAILFELALMDHAKGWTQQFHLGALRNTNTRMMRTLGPDTGYDSIGDFDIARPLARFLDRLDTDGRLAKTILYNLNPRDNEVLATMIGNFQEGPVAGKLQYGSAWWFLDQLDGMTRQLESLSVMGLLSQFVGMLTDSRSFLSYPRHEYFRRLLCNLLGSDMHRGLLPTDYTLVGDLVRGVCYGNARRFFEFPTTATTGKDA